MTFRQLQLGSMVIGGCLTLALASGPAFAGIARTAVALEGSDSGSCPVATPCRTLVYALTQTNPGGEILIKDSAGFGPITITQAVTINAPPGVIGFISATSGDAITVNAGLTDLVIVTGLYLDGVGTGANGVTVNQVGSFSIGGSTITGFTGNPINYVNTSTSGQHLTISSSSFYNNTGSVLVKPVVSGTNSLFCSIRGLALSTSGMVFDNTSAPNTKIGALFDNSILRYNGGTAITANSAGTSGIFVNVYIDKSEFFNLNTAFNTSGGAFVLLNESAFVNITTLVASGANVSSIGNNMVSVATIGTLGTQAPK